MAITNGGFLASAEATAAPEWKNATPGSRELMIAAAYEAFWQGALLSLAFIAVCSAWLFEGRDRAKLSTIIGFALLFFFNPGVFHVAGLYDGSAERPPAWTGIFMFGMPFYAGVLHLAYDEDIVNKGDDPVTGFLPNRGTILIDK